MRVDVVMAEAAPAAKESVAMATVAVVRWIAGSGGEVEKEGGGGKGCGGDGDGGEVANSRGNKEAKKKENCRGGTPKKVAG